MRVAVLRASGKNWNPEVFAKKHKLKLETVWQPGAQRARRRRTDAGFNLTICDWESESKATIGAEITSWLRRHSAMLTDLKKAGARGQVDIGVTVGTSDQMNRRGPGIRSELCGCAINC